MNNFEQPAKVLKALGHSARLRIVAGLIEDECNVSQIQRSLQLPQSTISQHLKVLKNAGIIEGRREGTRVCYRVLDNWVRQVIKRLERK